MMGAALVFTFAGCAVSSGSGDAADVNSGSSRRAPHNAARKGARPTKAEVIASAKEFMRAYCGKNAEGYFPEKSELALPLKAQFNGKTRRWRVEFGNGLTCNVFSVEMDEAATRGAMSHLQGGRILQSGDKYDWEAPLNLRTLREFRAAVQFSKSKKAAAPKKAETSKS
jgi:hypothetical protein